MRRRASASPARTRVTATLDDNATSRDFISLLPLTLTLEDYNGTERSAACRRSCQRHFSATRTAAPRVVAIAWPGWPGTAIRSATDTANSV